MIKSHPKDGQSVQFCPMYKKTQILHLLSLFRIMHSVILNAALILSTAVLVLSNHIPLQNVLTNQIRVHYSE